MKLRLVKGNLEDSRTVHKCDVCGRYGTWECGWRWYGTVEEVEYKICSDKCQKDITTHVAKIRR